MAAVWLGLFLAPAYAVQLEVAGATIETDELSCIEWPAGSGDMWCRMDPDVLGARRDAGAVDGKGTEPRGTDTPPKPESKPASRAASQPVELPQLPEGDLTAIPFEPRIERTVKYRSGQSLGDLLRGQSNIEIVIPCGEHDLRNVPTKLYNIRDAVVRGEEGCADGKPVLLLPKVWVQNQGPVRRLLFRNLEFVGKRYGETSASECFYLYQGHSSLTGDESADGSGEQFDVVAFDDVVIRKCSNNIFIPNDGVGRYTFKNVTLKDGGYYQKGKGGKYHLIYASCKAFASCEVRVIGSRFEGPMNHCGANMIRSRAATTILIGNVFDGRAGCLSKTIDTAPSTKLLIVRDNKIHVGHTGNSDENPNVMLPARGKGGVTLIEDTEIWTRRPLAALVDSCCGGIERLTLRNVKFHHTQGCRPGAGPSDYNCLVKGGKPGATVENVTVDRADWE